MVMSQFSLIIKYSAKKGKAYEQASPVTGCDAAFVVDNACVSCAGSDFPA
jgi:hypothetical protein